MWKSLVIIIFKLLILIEIVMINKPEWLKTTCFVLLYFHEYVSSRCQISGFPIFYSVIILCKANTTQTVLISQTNFLKETRPTCIWIYTYISYITCWLACKSGFQRFRKVPGGHIAAKASRCYLDFCSSQTATGRCIAQPLAIWGVSRL